MSEQSAFQPRHVRHTAFLHVAASVSTTMSLFSPDGERGWVEGWDPEYLYPRSGEFIPRAIFRTQHGGEETLWLVLRYDLQGGIAEYVRITPGSRIGTVQIRAEARGQCLTRVHVTYELTAISAAGNSVLEALTPKAYAETIADWEERIKRYLSSADV